MHYAVVAVKGFVQYNSLVGGRAGTRQERLLSRLGERVRQLRAERHMSRAELATRSGLSVRYLAELESGAGNISVARLADVASALGAQASALLGAAEAVEPAGAGVIALLGLRGAGKSTLGAALAERLAVPFVELDALVEASAGMALAQIFELHGERYFRRLERETLARFLVDNPHAVLAPGGGIVTEPESLDLLRRHTTTVWLRARPQDHWDRVVAQGDRRPMADRAHAMEELEELLRSREPLYAQASAVVDTSTLTVADAVERLMAALGAAAAPPPGE